MRFSRDNCKKIRLPCDLLKNHAYVQTYPPFTQTSNFAFENLTLTISVMFSVAIAQMSALFGWIIKRLVSPEIRGEFA